jgi:hypothetical protein
MEENYTITLTCLFCDSPLQKEANQEVQSGDFIKCKNCDQDNDYDSLISIAKEKGLELVKDDLNDEIKKMFKKFGK